MAQRPRGFGLTRELDEKKDSKYSLELERELSSWIAARTGRQMEGSGQDAFRDFLLDGTVLCDLINSFNLSGISCKPNATAGLKVVGLKQMKESENIAMFLKAAEDMGVERSDLFQTADLQDNTNMYQVLNGISAVGRTALTMGISGAHIGRRN